jgi:hypothetical protein
VAKLISRETKGRLATLLTEAKTREGLYVDAALFGAVSAALQVHGTEISFLKKKAQKESEPFEIGQFFVDVAVDLILSHAAGKLLQLGLESMLRPLVRSRQAYFVVPQVPAAKDIKIRPLPEVRLTAEALKQARLDAHRKLKDNFAEVVDSPEYGAYKTIPEAMISSVLGARASIESAVNVNSPKSPAAGTTTREGMTVVVQLVTSAQNAYMLQMSAVDQLYGKLAVALDYTDIEEKVGAEWKAFLEENTAEGIDQPSLQKYRDLLLMYYEFAMWAHSVDLQSVAPERMTHKPHLMSERRLDEYLRSIDEFEIKHQDADRVTYRYPAIGTNPDSDLAGGVSMERTVAIAKERLDYWINHFPYSFEDLDGPTIMEKFEQRYANYKSAGNKESMRVAAYQYLLRAFGRVDENLKNSYRKLKDARALTK